jgi:hypothetical protein
MMRAQVSAHSHILCAHNLRDHAFRQNLMLMGKDRIIGIHMNYRIIETDHRTITHAITEFSPANKLAPLDILKIFSFSLFISIPPTKEERRIRSSVLILLDF